MPIHDWTKVYSGIFHDFHQAWIIELRNVLNGGLLPSDFYALAEQITRPFGPDVLTLKENGGLHPLASTPNTVALLEKPPRVRLIQESDAELYVKKANHVAIRHASDDRVIAILEVVSPGNKSSQHAIDAFLNKVEANLEDGIHLLLIDLFPPTSRDPHGIHSLIWGDAAPNPPDELPLTLVAYNAADVRQAFVEPTAVGNELIDMPLFLDDLNYVLVPLEATYRAAWRGVPRRWKEILEQRTSASGGE
jgi:hypothetical protein